MNELFLALGIESWKPVLAALLLPPVPLLLLALVGARLLPRRRALGWLLLLLALGGLWLSGTGAVRSGLLRWPLMPPPALGEAQIAALKRAPHTAIVVLGGGRRSFAPEYGTAMLHPRGIERLRPLRWTEAESRDTRENAIRTVALLHPQGVEHIVLVTHDYHMRRALRNFDRALATAGVAMRVTPAPMGLGDDAPLTLLDWLPSLSGFEQTRLVLHESLGLLVGA